MRILHVYLHIQPEKIEAFKELASYNAANSNQEEGCSRFEVLQQEDDSTRFMLIEHYRDEAAVEAHRQTAHYARWAATINDLTQGERTRSWWIAVA